MGERERGCNGVYCFVRRLRFSCQLDVGLFLLVFSFLFFVYFFPLLLPAFLSALLPGKRVFGGGVLVVVGLGFFGIW